MIQELVYTSVPKGLMPDSQGFCTVSCTHGMAPNLLRELEKLSGYRHPFLPGDPNYTLNPISCVHAIRRIGGVDYHILSQITDCGLDYTQRTNKIAHHFAFENSELTQCGPAAILSASGLFLTSWDGKPSETEPRTKLVNVSANPKKCLAWEQIFGDAGWGGVLAQAAEEGRPISVIFEPGQFILPLIAESFSLLPPDKRWKTTFSTFFTKSQEPGREKIQIKGILVGSEEMAYARLSQTTLIVDLTQQKISDSLVGKYVEAARTGNVTSPKSIRVPLSSTSAGEKSEQDKVKTELKTSEFAEEPGAYDLEFSTVPIPISIPARRRKPQITTPTRQGRKSLFKQRMIYIIGLLFCIIVGLIAVFNKNIVEFATTDKTTETAEPQIQSENEAAAAKEAKEKADAERAAAEKLQAEREREKQKLAAERAEKERLAAEEKAAADAKVEAERRKKIINDLPDFWGVPGVKSSASKNLAKSEQLGKHKEQVTLEFVPLVKLAENEDFLRIKNDYDQSTQTIKFWREETKGPAIDSDTATIIIKPVAVINLTDSGLKFEWDSSIINIDEDLKRQYNRILLSKLRIVLDGESKEIALLAPVVYERGLSGGCPTLGGEPFKLWKDVPYIVSPSEAVIH
ncbi:MAG: hypothetical protein ACRC2T_15280, partial [Thermoguttaceae bacterium]